MKLFIAMDTSYNFSLMMSVMDASKFDTVYSSIFVSVNSFILFCTYSCIMFTVDFA